MVTTSDRDVSPGRKGSYYLCGINATVEDEFSLDTRRSDKK